MSEFIIEDLPYHIKRVYVHGYNSYNWPWNIKVNTQFDSNLDPFKMD